MDVTQAFMITFVLVLAMLGAICMIVAARRWIVHRQMRQRYRKMYGERFW